MNLRDKILQSARNHFEDIVKIRRHLHQYPELSNEENETARFIKEQLDSIGIQYQEIFKTGVTGIIQGKNPQKKVVALRADIDALPVNEATGLPFASRNKGIMHACGHDAHTASLLGTLKILNELKDSFEGTIKFIFQPAEEKLPGGAIQLIKEGVLENPKPDLIIGQHVYPDLPSGTLGFRPGAYMASSDEIFIKLEGKGGHGATPDKITDTVLTASQIITSLHQTINRISPPTIPTVISIGKIIADGATNVIPGKVNIEGTFRTMDETWRNKAHEKIEAIATSIAQNADIKCFTEIKKGYPVLINHEGLTRQAMDFSSQLWGEKNIRILDKRMTAEDFAYYCHVIPGIFYRLGTGEKKNEQNYPLHSSKFNINEQALETGMATMAWLAIKNSETNPPE
ncbi:MAG: M20 family metallopeptidase [Bacteroidales bacterium]